MGTQMNWRQTSKTLDVVKEEDDIEKVMNELETTNKELQEQKNLAVKLGKLCKTLHDEKQRDKDGYVEMISNLERKLNAANEKLSKLNGGDDESDESGPKGKEEKVEKRNTDQDAINKQTIENLNNELNEVRKKFKEHDNLSSKIENQYKNAQESSQQTDTSSSCSTSEESIDDLKERLFNTNMKLNEKRHSKRQLKIKYKAVVVELEIQKRNNLKQEKKLSKYLQRFEKYLNLDQDLKETQQTCENYKSSTASMEQKNKELQRKLEESEARCESLSCLQSRVNELESLLQEEKLKYNQAIDDCRSIEFRADEEIENLKEEVKMKFFEKLQEFEGRATKAEMKLKLMTERYYTARFQLEEMKHRTLTTPQSETMNGCAQT